MLAALSAVAVALSGPAPAFAGPEDEAREARRAADRAEAVLEDATVVARNAAKRLEVATAKLPAAHRKVAAARGIVAAARAEARTARRSSDAAAAVHRQVVVRFEMAQDRVDQARDRVDDVAAASYMGGNITAINVLIGATGPRDIMDRMSMIGQVMQKQQDSVEEMTTARRVARVEQDSAGLAKRAAMDTSRLAADKYRAARSAQQAAVKARAAVIVLASSRRAALATAQSQRTAVLAKYEEARAEEERIVAALRDWDAKDDSGPVSVYAGGRLMMPVHGWKSSDFGQRYDPYYGVWQLHAGMDIAADGGTPIHAAASGRVIRAGYNGGYGNYTCISHGRLSGEGFSTCYGHQSQIGVYVGERVRRGEVIGRVGSTGASTGNHLHFETRFSGVPRNPSNYLPGCLC
jgi:murein DD-endopeptidase MepM/ murein hydrolase activator NlpD